MILITDAPSGFIQSDVSSSIFHAINPPSAHPPNTIDAFAPVKQVIGLPFGESKVCIHVKVSPSIFHALILPISLNISH
jgi:hypothetical protein